MTETQASLSCSNLRHCWGYTSSEITIYQISWILPKANTRHCAQLSLDVLQVFFSYHFYLWTRIDLWKKWQSLSHVWLFSTLWTVTHQVPLSMGFSRQEYWSGLSFPSPGDLPDPGIKPRSPILWQILYHLSYQGSPYWLICFKG